MARVILSVAFFTIFVPAASAQEPTSAPTEVEQPTSEPSVETREADACLPVVAADCGCVYSCGQGWLVGESTYLVRHSFWREHALTARIDEWCVDGECTRAFYGEIVCDGICDPRPADPTCHFEEIEGVRVCVGSPVTE